MVDAPRRHIRYATFLDTESHHFISTVLVIRILFIEGYFFNQFYGKITNQNVFF